MKFLWVILIITDTNTTPIGYFISQEACIEAAQEAFFVAPKSNDGSVAPWEIKLPMTGQFACVPVQSPMHN